MVITLTGCRKKMSDYEAIQLPSDFGQGWAVRRIGGADNEAVYHVLIDDTQGHHTCECLGFLRHGYCKHITGILALKKSDKFSEPENRALVR